MSLDIPGLLAEHGPDGWPAVRMREIVELGAERDALRAEVERLRKDAIRYRWIRDNAYSDTSVDQFEGYRHWFAVYDKKREGLDVVIDRATLGEEKCNCPPTADCKCCGGRGPAVV